MRHSQPGSVPNGTRASYYALTSFLGGLIHNASRTMLILCFGFAVAAAAVNIGKSLWQIPAVRSFVAALKADLADTGSSAVDLNTQPPPDVKDVAKADRDENKARRKLAEELKQKKASARRAQALRQSGSGI